MKLCMSQPDLLGKPPTCGIDDAVWTQISNLLTDLYPGMDVVERRRDERYPFPGLVYLTPVGEDGITPEGEPIVAAGRDISEGGLAFYHPWPLPSQQMIVSMETSDGRWLGFLIELTRSRSIRQGWCESSGRFVGPATSPLEFDILPPAT